MLTKRQESLLKDRASISTVGCYSFCYQLLANLDMIRGKTAQAFASMDLVVSASFDTRILSQ